ncbi:MAG: helix-turn-helix domain-containing protein [Coprobacillaceae bacterium]
MNFSKKLRQLRKDRGYSQEDLARECGVSRQAVSKWESNNSYPETDKLLYLSELFNVSIDYLMKDSIKIINTIFEKDKEEQGTKEIYRDFIDSWCNIELSRWDVGYNQCYIVDQIGKYILFYQLEKRQLKLGIIDGTQVDSITQTPLSKRKEKSLPEIPEYKREIDKELFMYFLKKRCNIQMRSPDLKSLILSADGYHDANIISVDDNVVIIKVNKETISIKKKEIVGMVEN